MSEKKELNQEQLKKVVGGEMPYRFCYICNTATAPKEAIQTIGNTTYSTLVCSACNTPYMNRQ